MKLCDRTFQAFISKQFKVIFSACWTGFVLSLESFTACAAEVGTTTFRLVWVSEYQAAYRTFRLENTRKWFDKLAVISSKHLLLWPDMKLCPSHSSSLCSQWCVGGWSFLLLSKFCLLCVYIQSQVNKLHHNSYQIIGCHDCVCKLPMYPPSFVTGYW